MLTISSISIAFQGISIAFHNVHTNGLSLMLLVCPREASTTNRYIQYFNCLSCSTYIRMNNILKKIPVRRCDACSVLNTHIYIYIHFISACFKNWGLLFALVKRQVWGHQRSIIKNNRIARNSKIIRRVHFTLRKLRCRGPPPPNVKRD